MICHLGLFVCTTLKQRNRIEATFASTRYAEKLNSGMGLVKTRRLIGLDAEAAEGKGRDAAAGAEGRTSLFSAEVRKEQRPREVKQRPIFSK